MFLETEQPNMVASVTSILNSANTAEIGSEDRPEINVRMFTTSYNGAFEDDAVSNAHLSNLKFTFSSFYRNTGSDAFTKAYGQKYNGLLPDRYAIRGFDVTMDVLLKLAYKNNLFETSKYIGLTEYAGNGFDYFDDWTSGYFNRACYIMEYNDFRIKEVEPKMTAKVTYNGNLRTTCVHIRSGSKYITDAPIDNNGKGEAFTYRYRSDRIGQLHDDNDGHQGP